MNFLFKSESIDYEFFFNPNVDKTILFLHGWGGNKNSFITTIKLLKYKYNILSLTMPTIQPTNEVWTLQDFCNLVLSILKIHNINSVSIICHSFGFRIATILKNFINIEKVVVTGGAGPKKENLITRIKTQNNKIILNKKRFKFLFTKIASKEYFSLSNTNKVTFKNIVNFNTKKCLSFNCPILLFWGTRDTETKIWIAKLIKKYNHVKLIKTNSDHFAYLKLNSLFNHNVVEFFG